MDNNNEFRPRTIIWAIIIGLLMLVLSIYLDAVAGLDTNVAAIASMLGVLLIPLIGGPTSRTEVNIMQTCVSAVAFTCFAVTSNYISVLFAGGKFDFFGITVTMLLGSGIGICMVTLFRDQYVNDQTLPFPQSIMAVTAISKVGNLKSSEAKMLFAFTGIGFLISAMQNFGDLPAMITFTSYLPKGMTLGILVMPMMLALGYFVGAKIGICLFVTSLIVTLAEGYFGTAAGWFADASQDYSGLQNFNLPMVFGMTLVAAFIPMFKQRKAIVNAFKIKTGSERETDNDMPIRKLMVIMLIMSVILVAFLSIRFGIAPIPVIVMLIIALICSIIGVRVIAESGLSALYALNLMQVLISYLLTRNLTVSLMLPAMCTCIQGLAINTMGDLKTGKLVGSSPMHQIWAQFIGAAVGVVATVIIVNALLKNYGLDSQLFSFPAAHIYYSLGSGLAEGGAAFGFGKMIIGVVIGTVLTFAQLPAAAIALAFFLPSSSMLGIATGGIIRMVIEKIKGKEWAEKINNCATGLIVGDAFACALLIISILH